jgi:RNA polymerase sigma-70 factor (ECF subfamily)
VPEAESRLRTLMLAGLSGDAASYRELLRELAIYLRAYYQRRLADGGADADDLVQETLIAVHSRRKSYDRSQPFTAWAYAMARYKLIDHLRRVRVRAAVPIDACEDLFASDEREPADASRDVERLLSTLPQRQRDAIRLTKLEGLSVDEAARRTGQSAVATKVGVHRGLKRLRVLLNLSEPDAND